MKTCAKTGTKKCILVDDLISRMMSQKGPNVNPDFMSIFERRFILMHGWYNKVSYRFGYKKS